MNIVMSTSHSELVELTSRIDEKNGSWCEAINSISLYALNASQTKRTIMGVFAYDDENSSTVPPAILYKALTKDSDSIFPKVIPAIQSIELVEGNGGPGTVKKVSTIQGGETSFVLQKVDAVDEANLGYDYSIVGGTGLHESLEKIILQTKVVPGPDGGSISKVSVKYHTKGDAPLLDAVREESKARGTGAFKAVEGYVLANPAEY
ncbi:unnamed protein product [Sphenostylis stenocarpa]|uniref:Bet v I/Major latex protein domain-containing protein n=1 Tax=Sphenostylis stenocarpa TaxID=92480 RepID=A0AA86VGY3_9FABA|nr:unnamed protein product [Sphenostylis stenocarpa]